MYNNYIPIQKANKNGRANPGAWLFQISQQHLKSTVTPKPHCQSTNECLEMVSIFNKLVTRQVDGCPENLPLSLCRHSTQGTSDFPFYCYTT